MRGMIQQLGSERQLRVFIWTAPPTFNDVARPHAMVRKIKATYRLTVPIAVTKTLTTPTIRERTSIQLTRSKTCRGC